MFGLAFHHASKPMGTVNSDRFQMAKMVTLGLGWSVTQALVGRGHSELSGARSQRGQGVTVPLVGRCLLDAYPTPQLSAEVRLRLKDFGPGVIRHRWSADK
jgi:hypothetical protein